MSGTTLGYHKANYTKRLWESLKEFSEAEAVVRRKREVISNKLVWGMTTTYLEQIDLNFNEWYFSPAIPERIYFTGDEFQTTLKILWDRIHLIKQRNNGNEE